MREILVAFEIENELRRKEFVKKIKRLAACNRILSNAYIVRSSNKIVKILGYDERRY